MNNSFKFLSREEEKKLTKEEQKEYYLRIREYYKKQALLQDKTYEDIHEVYQVLAKRIRKYELEVLGQENILDDTCIFACNHSNSHDYYTLQEILTKNFYSLCAKDSLNTMNKVLLKLGSCVFIDRNDSISAFKGRNALIEKVLQKRNVVIFPEGTWCVHPAKLLLPFHMGVIKIAKITGKPIIPIVMEYIETDKIEQLEKNMIKKCVVMIGKPIYVEIDSDEKTKLEELKEAMATLKWMIYESQPTMKRDELDFQVFSNHDALKMDTQMFKYDYQKEEKYIYGNDLYMYQDYPINRVFVKK